MYMYIYIYILLFLSPKSQILFILHIVICLYIFVFFSLGYDKLQSLPQGGYILLTEIKFTTSGTIRYNVIKTSY
jgi:hypothetical protein